MTNGQQQPTDILNHGGILQFSPDVPDNWPRLNLGLLQ